MSSKFTAPGLAALLETVAKPHRLKLALIVVVICQILMTPLDLRIHALSGGLGKPSLLFAADAKILLDRLRSLGEEGRHVLALSYIIDLLFPIALAAACIQAIWMAFRQSAPALALSLCLAAFAFWLLDLAEKCASFVLLVRFPNVDMGLATVTADLTTVKLGFLAVTYAGLLAAVAAWVLRIMQNRFPSN